MEPTTCFLWLIKNVPCSENTPRKWFRAFFDFHADVLGRFDVVRIQHNMPNDIFLVRPRSDAIVVSEFTGTATEPK